MVKEVADLKVGNRPRSRACFACVGSAVPFTAEQVDILAAAKGSCRTTHTTARTFALLTAMNTKLKIGLLAFTRRVAVPERSQACSRLDVGALAPSRAEFRFTLALNIRAVICRPLSVESLCRASGPACCFLWHKVCKALHLSDEYHESRCRIVSSVSE